MPKRQRASPSSARQGRAGPPGLIELERFTESTLRQWKKYSQDLDELQQTLFFGVRPEQQRLHQEIIAALREAAPVQVELDGWCRIVPYRHSMEPLSCAGSLQGVGGRFNAGIDLDEDTLVEIAMTRSELTITMRAATGNPRCATPPRGDTGARP